MWLYESYITSLYSDFFIHKMGDLHPNFQDDCEDESKVLYHTLNMVGVPKVLSRNRTIIAS